MSPSDDLSRQIMDRFAEATGLVGEAPPRRYLWTDAFAVCNYLGLWVEDGNERYLELARRLVEQVHHTLGRHRDDDARSGWISGLDEDEGARHPTVGGLRIGKEHPERGADEPLDPQAEWERDGQYFHYLTRWMHALYRMFAVTGTDAYLRQARELARAAHDAFTVAGDGMEPSRMVWKMSIDLSRPLVPSMGQHDPLDGLVTYLELHSVEAEDSPGPELGQEIAEAMALCWGMDWATGDPLGVGGLLTNAARLARLVDDSKGPRSDLLRQLVVDGGDSLEIVARRDPLEAPPERRLPFRELGMAIGLQAVDRARGHLVGAGVQEARLEAISRHRPLAEAIRSFWSDRDHRRVATWTEHHDINAVMLATTRAPSGYLGD